METVQDSSNMYIDRHSIPWSVLRLRWRKDERQYHPELTVLFIYSRVTEERQNMRLDLPYGC